MKIQLNQSQSYDIRKGFQCVIDFVFTSLPVPSVFLLRLAESCVKDPSIRYQSNLANVARIVGEKCDTFEKMWDVIQYIDASLRPAYPERVNSFRMVVKALWLEANNIEAFIECNIISHTFYDTDVAKHPLEIEFYGMYDPNYIISQNEVRPADYILAKNELND